MTRRRIAMALAFAPAACLLRNATARTPEIGKGKILATRVFTVADDFVVEVYHNGLRVPDDKRTLLVEQFGATAERVDVEVREGDWLAFNVVNNRLRWGGVSYFGAAGRGDGGVAFVSELKSGRWSCCDDPGRVGRFVADRDYLSEDRAGAIARPWEGGDPLMTQVADGWSGTPLWGKTPNTWIKYVAR
jgi:hypothetical protein